MSDFSVRAAMPTDAEFLIEMLVEAINWLPQRNWSRERIMADPSLAHYVSDWMRADDLGVVAIDAADLPIGEAWLRFLPAEDRGYGYVGDDVPELTMGVAQPCRRRGVGRALLRAVLVAARERGVGSVSLSVERANFAARLYASEGFHTVDSFDDADTMVKEGITERIQPINSGDVGWAGGTGVGQAPSGPAGYGRYRATSQRRWATWG